MLTDKQCIKELQKYYDALDIASPETDSFYNDTIKKDIYAWTIYSELEEFDYTLTIDRKNEKIEFKIIN